MQEPAHDGPPAAPVVPPILDYGRPQQIGPTAYELLVRTIKIIQRNIQFALNAIPILAAIVCGVAIGAGIGASLHSHDRYFTIGDFAWEEARINFPLSDKDRRYFPTAILAAPTAVPIGLSKAVLQQLQEQDSPDIFAKMNQETFDQNLTLVKVNNSFHAGYPSDTEEEGTRVMNAVADVLQQQGLPVHLLISHSVYPTDNLSRVWYGGVIGGLLSIAVLIWLRNRAGAGRKGVCSSSYVHRAA